MKANVTLAALVGALLISSASLVRAEEPAASATPATPPAAPDTRLFGGVVANKAHLTATVEKIDYLSRQVILKGDNGERKAITAGPEVKRLMEIRVGDTIDIEYAETVLVLAGDNAGGPAHEESTKVQRATKEESPGGVLVKTTRVLATVEALDFKARTATLRGPNRTVTINVPPEAVNFEKVKVGDSVFLEYTQSIAAAVTKKAPAPAK
jgi:hypothetical protein